MSMIQHGTDWEKVASDVKSRTPTQCKNKYYHSRIKEAESSGKFLATVDKLARTTKNLSKALSDLAPHAQRNQDQAE